MENRKYTGEELERRRAYKERKRKALKRKKRRLIIEALLEMLVPVVAIAAIVMLVICLIKLVKGNGQEVVTDTTSSDAIIYDLSQISGTIDTTEQTVSEDEVQFAATGYGSSTPEAYGLFEGYIVDASDASYIYDENMTSDYAVIIDASTGKVIAAKNANDIINPASMTKIMTVLVAVEHITDLDDVVEITADATNYAYSNDLSAVCFAIGEKVTVRDLLYGTILPSGGDAAYALADYVAGSQDAFVEMMNKKLADLGLSDTAHFTNVAGLYNENHYCTVTDMAIILKAAMENELCRDVMSAHTYVTTATPEHPDGIQVSNWFLRRIEDKDCHGTVLCAKTGFVNESRNCAASYQLSNDGNQYIVCTAGTWSSWRCIYDHVQIYEDYTK